MTISRKFLKYLKETHPDSVDPYLEIEKLRTEHMINYQLDNWPIFIIGMLAGCGLFVVMQLIYTLLTWLFPGLKASPFFT